MAVNAIQETSPKNHTSYIGATALGALIGHSVKYLLPITPQEKDDNFKSAMQQIEAEAQKTREAEIKAIKESNDKTEATDRFIKMSEGNKELNETEIRKLPENMIESVMKLKFKVDEKVAQTIEAGKANLITRTKGLRPTYVFVLLGATIGLWAAFTMNLARSFNKSHNGFETYD